MKSHATARIHPARVPVSGSDVSFRMVDFARRNAERAGVAHVITLNGGDALLEALAARPHVKALVSGHLHDAFEFVGPNGLALLGCPSTLMAIGHEGNTFSIGVAAPTGARILRLSDDGTFTTSLLIA